MGSYRTILFDLGNVLFCDPWETLLLTPGTGLADVHGWDRRAVTNTGQKLWGKYSIIKSSEAEYWEDFKSLLGVQISQSEIENASSRLLYPNPNATGILESAAATGARIGIASNNTSFWFSLQWELLNLQRFIDPNLVFVSHELGVEKSTPGEGILEIAKNYTDARETLFVDDRQGNLDRARSIGYQTLWYSLSDGSALPDLS
ncbi:hypothetical protein [Streptomyces sp. NPDC126522]|uniref:HAD family hydrolase n=1 Tax=Streptomyces sp. NPDC126522 TaxID=3155211 RepID=UPI00332361F9